MISTEQKWRLFNNSCEVVQTVEIHNHTSDTNYLYGKQSRYRNINKFKFFWIILLNDAILKMLLLQFTWND